MRQSQQKSSAFSSAEMFKKPLWQTVWTQIRTAPIGAVCSRSTLFASILNFFSNVRELFATDDSSRLHFQMHFFLGALRVKDSVVCYWHDLFFFIFYSIKPVEKAAEQQAIEVVLISDELFR